MRPLSPSRSGDVIWRCRRGVAGRGGFAADASPRCPDSGGILGNRLVRGLGEGRSLSGLVKHELPSSVESSLLASSSDGPCCRADIHVSVVTMFETDSHTH